MQLKLLLLAMIVFLAGCRPIAAPTATPVPTPAFAHLLKQYEAWQTQALARIDAYDADPTIFADSTWRLQTAAILADAEQTVRALAERAGRNRDVYFGLADSYAGGGECGGRRRFQFCDGRLQHPASDRYGRVARAGFVQGWGFQCERFFPDDNVHYPREWERGGFGPS